MKDDYFQEGEYGQNCKLLGGRAQETPASLNPSKFICDSPGLLRPGSAAVLSPGMCLGYHMSEELLTQLKLRPDHPSLFVLFPDSLLAPSIDYEPHYLGDR